MHPIHATYSNMQPMRNLQLLQITPSNTHSSMQRQYSKHSSIRSSSTQRQIVQVTCNVHSSSMSLSDYFVQIIFCNNQTFLSCKAVLALENIRFYLCIYIERLCLRACKEEYVKELKTEELFFQHGIRAYLRTHRPTLLHYD